jgi:hypothetical protein
MPPARNPDHDLIEVPLVSRRRQTPPDLVGITLPELQRPLPHGLVADLDASGREHFLDHPQAERKYSQTAWLITSAGKRWRA